ncbi:MAG: CHAT domain-containing protein, partial [Chloroflexi bacterium]|nr:CHAT domain-containing protein [Chloroflexota bacterium]
MSTDQSAAALVAELLSYPADRRAEWLAEHRGLIQLPLIAAFKAYSDPLALSDPAAADDATRCALLAAGFCCDPLAGALAAWARGNWEIYHDPQRAIQCYQQALAGYRHADDSLSVARLLTNLVFPYTECGALNEAEAAADEARDRLLALGDAAAQYLMTLEQNVGWMLHHQGRYAEALDAYGRSLALAYRLDQPAAIVEIQVNRSVTLKLVGSLDGEEALLLGSRAVAEAGEQWLTVARIDMNLGELYTAQGRPFDALRRFQSALAVFTAFDNRMEMGWVLLYEGGLLSTLGAVRAARRCYEQAHDYFAALRLTPQIGLTLLRSAIASRKHGAYAHALKLLESAEVLWRSLEQPVWLAAVRLERAELALAQADSAATLAHVQIDLPAAGHPPLEAHRDVLIADALALAWRADGDDQQRQRAMGHYQQVLRYAQAKGDRWLERRSLAGLARLTSQDQPQQARATIEAALALDDATRRALSVEELKASFHQQHNDLLPLLVRLVAAHESPLATLSAIWRAKGGALLDLLQDTNGEAGYAPEIQARIEDTRQQLAIQRWKLSRQSTAAMPDYLRERGDETTRRLEDLLSDLRRQRLPSAQTAAVLDAPERILRQLPADLLLEYMRCDDELLLVRADPQGGCQVHWLGPVAPVLDLVDDLQLHIQYVLAQPEERRSQLADAWLAECRPLLQQLHALLIAPLGELPPDARLLLAPCDALYGVPFAALWSGTRYLIEQHTLEYTPCGSLLSVPPPASSSAPPVIIAASADERLAAVREEAARIQVLLPDARCLINDPGTLPLLRQLPAAPRLLHIAAHSILREDAPIFAALQLQDDLLSVEECYNLALRGTVLATLSGCATATGLDSGGSLLAFQSALFVAGVQTVVSSLWPVDDRATAVWMEQFYRALGSDAAAAVRATQLALLADRRMEHPAIWAAFVCSRRDRKSV